MIKKAGKCMGINDHALKALIDIGKEPQRSLLGIVEFTNTNKIFEPSIRDIYFVSFVIHDRKILKKHLKSWFTFHGSVVFLLCLRSE